MFDKYIIQQKPTYSKVEVIEKKAPTDESIRLLKEMEEKTIASVINSIKVANNSFNGIVVHARKQSLDDSELWIKFKFNGKDCVIRQDVDEMDFMLDKYTAFQKLAEVISNKIFYELYTRYC